MTSRRFNPYTRPSTSSRSTISILSNAQGVAFNGNPTFHVNDSDRTAVPIEESLEAKGMKILREKVATGAMHNSGERFDSPKCHPGTRTALQNDVYRWVDEPLGGRLVTWLFGPAGAGKSAIAQTISQKLRAKGQLTASFFFSRRESASKGRGDESALIATLAYQLSQSVPPAKPLIARAVREDPLIFDLSLDDQIQALIVHPLTVVHQDGPECRYPSVIVVDGLDECRKDDNAQSRVVKALIVGLSNTPHRSQKLFITSRPEHNIVAAFRSCRPELIRKMELNDKWNPDDDIRAFLHAEFAEIRSSHPYFENHPADKMWPSQAGIDELIERSSGQFIYASVVIKYIKSEDYYDPAARLEVILQLKNNEDRPYAELDALYKHIFSQIQSVEKVLTILSLEHMLSANKFARFVDLSRFLSHLIGSRTEEIKFWLRPLVSILTWETNVYSGKDVIRYLHASLPDFLTDESRSDTFCINSIPIATRVVQQALDLLEDKDVFEKDVYFLPVLLRIPLHYAQKLSFQMHILSMLSDFNFAEKVLSRMHVSLLSYETIVVLGLYLEWILEASKNDPQKALVKHLSQIQTWIIERVVYKSFKQLNHTDQVDLWPFFTSSFLVQRGSMPLGSLRRDMSYDIVAAMEICGLPKFSYHVTRDENDKIPDQEVLFHHLMPHIPCWLADTTLLGRYAITGERYAVALMCTSRYMLQLPKYQLAAIRTGSQPKLSQSMYVAWRTFLNCMDHLPLSMELYFFVLYIHSVIVDHRQNSSDRIATSARAYLLMMRNKFPFLSDPASPEYMKAQADAEATWIETKRDLYDPILSIRVERLPDLTDIPDSDSDSNSGYVSDYDW